MSTRSVIWLAIYVFALFYGTIAHELFTPEGMQHHEATLVRDDIGYALKCWTLTGEDIFCQEVVTP